MIKDAYIDATGKYRYSLTRVWDRSLGKAVFIMLNPSTADAYEDDNTIRKCISFAKTWGFGMIEVVNLFAYRATDPRELKKTTNPVGDHNQKYILKAINSADKIIVAWGNHGKLYSQDKKVYESIKEFKPYHLGLNKTGCPRHPLYIRSNTEPKPFII